MLRTRRLRLPKVWVIASAVVPYVWAVHKKMLSKRSTVYFIPVAFFLIHSLFYKKKKNSEYCRETEAH